jgi:beta-lactamase regulating signal transducer with metallopeptidase domain
VIDGREALGALWTGYIVLLHATAYGLGIAALLPLLRNSTMRAAAHACLLVGMLTVTVLCWMPSGWWASLLPESVSEPLYWLGAASVAAGETPHIAAVQIARWLYVVWFVGAIVLLARLLLGWATMVFVTRRSTESSDPSWRAVLREASSAMGTGQVATLRFSSQVTTPLTWGTLDPQVILPLSAAEWSTDYRRMVLLHELAHVRRWDAAVQCLVAIVRAVYWFHPLVIWSASRFRDAREEAADAMVLSRDVKQSAYATCLLNLATVGSRQRSPCVAIAMLQGRKIEARVHRILADGPTAPPRLAFRAMIAVAAVWIVLTGSIRLAPQHSVTLERLASGDWAMRGYAAHLLGRTKVPAVRQRLQQTALHDPNPVVRRIAAYVP